MSGVATAIAGAAVVGYVASNQGSQRAADAMTNAANSANDTQLEMFNQQRADQSPYREAGYQALSQMQDPKFQDTFDMSKFQQDPGYQFRMQQGQQALERSAAARGGMNSGATLKSLTRYSQGAASDEYQSAYNRFTNDQSNRFNRLASIAGLGQTANGQVSQAGTAMATNTANNQMAMGNTQAALAMNQANSISNLANTGANSWMNYSMMNRAFPAATTYGGGGSTGSSGGGYGGGTGALGVNTTFQTAFD